MEEFSRINIVLGEDNVKKLAHKKVIIFGVGGVGGYVCEMLTRMGIENIDIVDFDIISRSNINRQIIALNSTIGKPKVEVMKARMLDINPNCKINAFNKKLTPENIEDFNLQQYDYVADCIDMVSSKIELIKYCNKRNINCLSAMGAGNRSSYPYFEVKDIFKTSYDGLAKVIRRKLNELNIKNHNVVICEQQTQKSSLVGSVVYYPAMCACVMSSKIIQDLIKINN